ncbi:Alkaline ceramidase 3 [Smittium mucronatum]|uniref:Alkaline ceramidase 3 n=1 Tax=Smittium mucronatum TaxID=133383 RepID=A0A1R0H7W9_9FUNG|nr:Alkaline ceramidase 3 [Smittium mucronatum]
MTMILADTSRNNSTYFWGERTSTLDWCEENYLTSNYIAEFWNTLTSMIFVVLAFISIRQCIKYKLQKRIIVLFLGIALVGIGSVLFHMTLKLSTQLLDELPMIYVTNSFAYLLIESGSELKYGLALPIFVFALDVAITVTYIFLLNPIFHQVSFGAVIIFSFVFSAILLRRLPNSSHGKKRLNSLLLRAFFGFLFGFAAWNLDNICCNSLRSFRIRFGAPWDALLQMHGWWHILTAYSAHCLSLFLTALRLEISGARPYDIKYFFPGIPFLSFENVKQD